MNWKFGYKLFVLSAKALHASFFRSFLTTLGIMIGAATIIIVAALGEGAKRDIEAQYSNMSVTTIIINGPSSESSPSKLSPDDIPYIESVASVDQVVPLLTGKVSVNTHENVNGSWTVVGTYSNFAEVSKLEFSEGDNFNQESEDNHVKVAIIGATVAEELYGSRTPDIVGQTIVLGKKEFEIIGVTKYRGGAFGPINIDESIFTPYSASYRYVLGKSGKFSFNVNATSLELLEPTMTELGKVLRDAHKIKVGGVDDFRLRDMGATVASAQSSSQTMALLLASVGLIVLLVGGIGIMNIMYVTVSERTREIGIRKAIGAKDRFIMTQFLMEAFILTLVGYVVGAVSSIGIYYLLIGMEFKIVFVPWSLLISFVVTFLTGMFFGYYPAKKAASLDPIDALRYE